jgi:ABC-type lipoprotein export system ATPase subunit
MIELKQIERSYKTGHTETWVLRHVNLTIRPGEFVTVMGPSGAGKSSLLNVLAMLDDQWRASSYFEGEAVHRMNRKQRADLARRRIGMVFQSYHLLDDLSVAENIDLPLSYKDIPRAGAAGAGGRHSRQIQHRRQERSLSEPALRRPAATGGHCARGHSQAQPAAGR